MQKVGLSQLRISVFLRVILLIQYVTRAISYSSFLHTVKTVTTNSHVLCSLCLCLPPPTSFDRMSVFKPWKSEFALWYLTDTQVEKVNYTPKAFWQESWLMLQLYHKTTRTVNAPAIKCLDGLILRERDNRVNHARLPFKLQVENTKANPSFLFLPSRPRSPLVFCVSVQRCLGERGWMNTRRFRLFSLSHGEESSLLSQRCKIVLDTQITKIPERTSPLAKVLFNECLLPSRLTTM